MSASLGERSEAEFLAAARGLGSFRGASSVSTRLYTIARSFCIKKRRRSVHALVAGGV